MKVKIVFLIVSIIVISCFSKLTYAQQKKSTVKTAQDTTKKKESFKLLMDAIEVRGWIEKPQTVFVVPGINPEVDDIILDRSFANEILRPLDKDKFEKQKVRKRRTVIPW